MCVLSASDSPVRDLLQVDFLVAVEQLGDIVSDDPNKEGDEHDGQDHPHPNAGVQQELRPGHRSLFNPGSKDRQGGAEEGVPHSLEEEVQHEVMLSVKSFY